MEKELEKKEDTQGVEEPNEIPKEETVSLKKFKSVWSERQKFKDELAEQEARISDYDQKIITFKAKIAEYKGIDEKLKLFESDRLKEKTDKWLEESKVLDIKEGDKGYDKVSKIKDKFTFATEEIPLSTEQIDKNAEIFGIYKDANYFEVQDVKDNTHKETTTTSLSRKDGKYFGYATPAQLAGADPKLAQKYKDEHGGKW